METRANNVFVGAVALGLLAALAAFFIWIARLNEGDQKKFDIFFKQSVNGLAKGSQVTFSGVPVGKIDKIELWPKDPSFVRVRISVDKQVPILVGTTASMQSSFTGTGEILLEGAVKGAPPITCPEDNPKSLCPEGEPVIPTKRSGIGAILNSAPLLLERLTTLSERLNLVLSDENLTAFHGILANSNKLTGNLADASPQMRKALDNLQVTLQQAKVTLADFDKVAGTAQMQLSDRNGSVAHELRMTLQTAQGAADQLKGVLTDARPATKQLSETTLPTAEAALRELRSATRSLRNITDKIAQQGAGALTSGSNLPDYKP